MNMLVGKAEVAARWVRGMGSAMTKEFVDMTKAGRERMNIE